MCVCVFVTIGALTTVPNGLKFGMGRQCTMGRFVGGCDLPRPSGGRGWKNAQKCRFQDKSSNKK